MRVCVVGLGYVGLPLAVACSKLHQVVGFDINKSRIKELRQCSDSTGEVSYEQLIDADGLHFTYESDECRDSEIYVVTVPTPVTAAKTPDLQPLKSAANFVGSVMPKNAIVVFESTVFPGCTESEAVPILERVSGLRHNVDFFTGYSPERINPADKERTITDIVKVVSGSSEGALKRIDSFYSSFILAGTHKVSSIATAEAAKVIENAQRDINIAFVNELAVLFYRLGIDTKEVLEAAGTKWNFLNFNPGLVGGHCIGIDPYYLAYRAQQVGHYPELLLAGRRINEAMVDFVAARVAKSTPQTIPRSEVRVLVMGLAFKEDCPDTRNSKAIDLVSELKSYGFEVQCLDPLVDPGDFPTLQITEECLLPQQYFDCFVITVAHKEFKSKPKEWFNNFGRAGFSVFDVKRGLRDIDGVVGL